MKRALFALLVLASLTVVFIPAYIIRPFRGQSPQALTLALTLRTWAPVVTLATGLAAVLLAVGLLRGARWRSRKAGLMALGMLLVIGSAALARYNYFERYFRPVTTPQFEPAAQAKLDADEMVLAVRSGAQARAYPIRAMAYHHLVNDTVGGVPLVATY